MAKEKKWSAIDPLSFTADGTNLGVVTVDDACIFRAKQKVFLESSTQSKRQYEVRTILSNTQFTVGEIGSKFDCLADVSSFLVSDNAQVSALEQPRPTITPDETLRYTYEEEPVVARRSVLVDKLGNIIDGFDFSQEGKNAPVIANITVADKDTETNFTFPANVIAYEIKLRGLGFMRLAFIETEAGTNYITIKQGNSYCEEGLKRTSSLTIYLETSKDNSVVEIKYWTK